MSSTDDWQNIEPGAPITEPCIAVPVDFAGTEAEAIALAVAGAVADFIRERDLWKGRVRRAHDALRDLLAVFPATSWAGPEAERVNAQELLAQLGEALGDTAEPEQRT